MAHYLVTGATGGVGRAVCQRLSGHQLTLVARQLAPLIELAAGLPDALAFAADLTDEAGAEALQGCLAERPVLDGVVHAVGSLLLKPAHRCSLSEWRAVMAANLDSAFLVLRIAAQAKMRGSLVLCSSVAARVGLNNHEAIAAAKAGVEGLVRAAAATYAGQGMRVNAVAPGLTETPLTAGLLASPQMRTALAQQHPLGRIGRAEDQAAAICWLLSDESAWITGQVLGVDGGYGAIRR